LLVGRCFVRLGAVVVVFNDVLKFAGTTEGFLEPGMPAKLGVIVYRVKKKSRGPPAMSEPAASVCGPKVYPRTYVPPTHATAYMENPVTGRADSRVVDTQPCEMTLSMACQPSYCIVFFALHAVFSFSKQVVR